MSEVDEFHKKLHDEKETSGLWPVFKGLLTAPLKAVQMATRGRGKNHIPSDHDYAVEQQLMEDDEDEV